MLAIDLRAVKFVETRSHMLGNNHVMRDEGMVQIYEMAWRGKRAIWIKLLLAKAYQNKKYSQDVRGPKERTKRLWKNRSMRNLKLFTRARNLESI
jgi:hypothetical protein